MVLDEGRVIECEESELLRIVHVLFSPHNHCRDPFSIDR